MQTLRAGQRSLSAPLRAAIKRATSPLAEQVRRSMEVQLSCIVVDKPSELRCSKEHDSDLSGITEYFSTMRCRRRNILSLQGRLRLNRTPMTHLVATTYMFQARLHLGSTAQRNGLNFVKKNLFELCVHIRRTRQHSRKCREGDAALSLQPQGSLVSTLLFKAAGRREVHFWHDNCDFDNFPRSDRNPTLLSTSRFLYMHGRVANLQPGIA